MSLYTAYNSLRRYVPLGRGKSQMARTPFAKPTPDEIRERLAASGKRPAHNSTLAIIGERGKVKAAEMRVAKRVAFKASGGRCIWPDCTLPAVDPHHIQSAGQCGASTAENIAPLCRCHHDRCISHRAEAESHGIVRSGHVFILLPTDRALGQAGAPIQ